MYSAASTEFEERWVPEKAHQMCAMRSSDLTPLVGQAPWRGPALCCRSTLSTWNVFSVSRAYEPLSPWQCLWHNIRIRRYIPLKGKYMGEFSLFNKCVSSEYNILSLTHIGSTLSIKKIKQVSQNQNHSSSLPQIVRISVQASRGWKVDGM